MLNNSHVDKDHNMIIMKIAVLLTCHNRKAKTERCLRSLKDALNTYNENEENRIHLEVFLTDDGCTDGTADAARSVFSDEKELHILQGDGNLYWAGGMRFCWKEAMKRHSEWDYYLLLNDDVELMNNLFDELLVVEKYAWDHYSKCGLVSGITCAQDNPDKLTYGGSVWKNRLLATKKRLVPGGKPQLCNQTNANILFVPQNIVDVVGILSEKYFHSAADYDYSYRVSNAGYPVLLTANFCGKCDYDHTDTNTRAEMVMKMRLKERKEYFSNPVRSDKDYLLLISQISPLRYPLVWLGRKLNIYFPRLYYRISNKRRGV